MEHPDRQDDEDWKNVAAAGLSDTFADASKLSLLLLLLNLILESTPDMMNNMASLSPTMMEGTTVKWYKEEFITNWDLLTRSNTS